MGMDLKAEEQASWGDGPPSTHALDVAKATAWREERLEFENQPLAQVVEELRRYTSTPSESPMVSRSL